METRIIRFHGVRGPISLVVDDYDTGEVHFVRLVVSDSDFDRTVAIALTHDSVFDFFGDLGHDICVRASDIVVAGTRGIHLVYVTGKRVFLVGDDATDEKKSEIVAFLDNALMSGIEPAWWRDYRLVNHLPKHLIKI